MCLRVLDVCLVKCVREPLSDVLLKLSVFLVGVRLKRLRLVWWSEVGRCIHAVQL